MILLVTNTEDKTADYLERNTKNSFLRFNTEKFLTEYKLSYSNSGFELQHVLSGKIVTNQNLKGVIYRRPTYPDVSADDGSTKLQEELRNEARIIYESILGSIDTRWISEPYSVRKAENKLLQLKYARNVGLSTPKTIVSNDKNQVEEFLRTANSRLCIKPMHLGIFEIKDEIYIPYNTIISYEDISAVDNYPTLIQEYVEKQYEVRVVIIGEAVFSIRIDSQKNADTKFDWRTNNCMAVEYSITEIPFEIENKCKQLMSEFNVNFASMDLAINENGEYVFLDLNPNGQWAWLDELLNLNMTNAFIDFFDKGDKYV